MWIVDLTAGTDGYSGKFIANALGAGPDAPAALKVSGDEIEFVISFGAEMNIHFKGKLAGGTIRGVADDKSRPVPFIAVRTDKAQLEDPYAERNAYQAALAQRDPKKKIEALEKFVRDYPKSTVVAASLANIFEASLQAEPDDLALAKTLDRFLAEFEKIPTLDDAARFTVYRDTAQLLAENSRLLAKAEELTLRAAPLLKDDAPAMARSDLMLTEGLLARRSGKIADAEELYKKALETNPRNSKASLELAQIHEAKGQFVQAADYYLGAYAQLGGESLLRMLEQNYRKAHGSLSGLHEAIDKRAAEQPPLIKTEPFAPAAKTGKVVLAELFTGSECGPCFGADKAYDALLDRFDASTLAVVEYHEHIPRPDPMTNADTEERGEYYQINGTPTSLIDGQARNSGGGAAPAAPILFERYRLEIEKQLAAKPGYEVAIKTERRGDALSVEVTLKAVTEFDASKHRLRIALVEDPVHYTGYNQVHLHRYVVRKMLGGAGGRAVSLGGGKFEVSDSVDLKALQESLKHYADEFEKKESSKFPERKHEINRENLSVVAFVQDDASKNVLQAAVVKVR